MIRLISLVWIVAVFLSCANKQQTAQELIKKTEPEILKLKSSLKRQRVELTPVVNSVSVVAVGDIMLGNHTAQYIRKYGVEYPFAATDSILRSGDIAVGNLEGPFAVSGTPFDKKFTFKVPPEFASSLAFAGFDVMTLANNHILDYGAEGLQRTISALDSLKISHCGAGLDLKAACTPAILEENGLKIAVFGYSMTFPAEFWASKTSGGTCFPYENILERTIPHYDSTCDIVIANFHWGRELKNAPRDYQRQTAHKAIDLGADLVIGHHPHVLQGVEIYKNRLIAYSLGNFAFASYSKRATESIILKVYLTKNGLLFARAVPINVNNYEVEFQPRPLSGKKAKEVIRHLNDYSRQLPAGAIFDSCGVIWGNLLTRYDSRALIDSVKFSFLQNKKISK
ncbi:MAG: CapA family protein [Calditrichaeota bacterium]|nr:CapA family protein [Calditrichota bacterium]